MLFVFYWYECPLIVFSLWDPACMHCVYLVLWHARFWMKVLYALYINFHLFIHSGTFRLLSRVPQYHQQQYMFFINHTSQSQFRDNVTSLVPSCPERWSPCSTELSVPCLTPPAREFPVCTKGHMKVALSSCSGRAAQCAESLCHPEMTANWFQTLWPLLQLWSILLSFNGNCH